MERMVLSMYLLALFAVLFAGCKQAGKGNFHEDFLSCSAMKNLQGFAALGVILHHVTQTVTKYGQFDKGIINVMVDAGVFFTALFFFCSGYGLVTSFFTKEEYMKGFLRKRLTAVLVPFYTCNLLFVLVSLLSGSNMKAGEFVLYISGIVLLNDQMWFIVELAFLYFLFYLCYRKSGNKELHLLKMAVAMVVMTLISLLLGHDGLPDSKGLWFFGEWWYNATWTFFAGMFFAQNKDRITSFLKQKYKVLLPVTTALFVVMYVATMIMLGIAGYWAEWPGHRGYVEKFLTFCVQAPTVIVFVFLLFLVSMKIQFRNRLLSWLSVIALEMYLLQNIFITYLRPFVKSDIFFYIGVYTGTILLAAVVHKINQRIIRKISVK